MLLFIVFILSPVRGNELIDLSYPHDKNSAYWTTTGIPFRFIKKTANSNRGYWLATNQFETAEHCGTHLDAPYHFNRLGWKLHEVPLYRLITTGVFLNASSETDGNCSYKLPAEELEKWECENGPFPNNAVLLISFGWGSRYNNKTDYFGPRNKFCFPGLSKEASEWITKSKKIVGVGLDTPSIDQGLNVDAHIELTSKNLYIMENVDFKRPLPKIFTIIVLPMKIRNGTGGPCRIVAIV
ncbi:kynurenine formamidase [Halyomorpha halys]|uniref:kynurenine formamidase n=1 Tax=Halyomorpha halys TaxID=286706 RepID=UPI0006D51886|nr:uncharacterized protein LOC106680344 [Halyomorpha halys]